MTWRRPVLVIVGLLSSAGFLLFAAVHLDFARVARGLASARLWPWVPLALLSYLAGHVARGVRLRRLVSREATLAIPTATNVVVVGYAVNNLLPARLGELARAWMLTEKSGLHFTQTLTVTLLERLLDGLVLLLLLGVTVLTLPALPTTSLALGIAGALFAAASCGVLMAVVAPGGLLALASRVVSPFGPRLLIASLRQVNAITAGVAYLRRPFGAMQVIALSVLVWLLEAGMFLFMLPAFTLPARPFAALLAMTTTNLGILLPSSPGYVGPFHFFCMQALASTGVPRDVAFGYAVLVHLIFYVPITLWGVGVLFAHGLSVGRAIALSREAQPLAVLPAAFEGMGALLGEGHREDVADAPSRLMLALAEACVPLDDDGLAGAERREALEQVAEFVHGQIGALPLRLRSAFATGLLAFSAATLLSTGRSFTALPLERRRALFEHWAYGRVALARHLFRGVRSAALLAYYEQPQVVRAVDARRRAGAFTGGPGG